MYNKIPPVNRQTLALTGFQLNGHTERFHLGPKCKDDKVLLYYLIGQLVTHVQDGCLEDLAANSANNADNLTPNKRLAASSKLS